MAASKQFGGKFEGLAGATLGRCVGD